MLSIVVGANDYNLIPLPVAPGLSDIVLGMNDAVAMTVSPYVPSQLQTQAWPGADGWDATLTVPPLTDAQAADWEGFLSELRGMSNVFRVGDPRRPHPLGIAHGTPTAAAGNTAMSTSLLTTGWTASTNRQL